MTTSLPFDSALFHMTAKIFKRSEGRSSVAAAAYRSGSCLHDSRIGRDFDYRNKPVITSFIMTSGGAPDWAHDREMLWNRVEEAERRKDAQVAREVEISIPRDIPEGHWEPFAREICQHYVAADAIVDVAIHCPADVYGNPQPHIHAMIAPRALDASTEAGFAKTRNTALAEIFESGGFRGGKRGDALKAERARVAGIMNGFLSAAASERRVSQESHKARGIDREPEMKLGEERIHAVKNRKKHDRKSALVSSSRSVGSMRNLKFKIEEDIMKTFPKHQAFKKVTDSISPSRKQNFKLKLLKDRFPGISGKINENLIHLVDVNNPAVTKIAMSDGGWIEVHGNRIRRYGKPNGNANDLVDILAAHVGVNEIEFLEEQQSIQKKGSGVRARRKTNDPAPELALSQVETLADKWRSRGFFNVTEAPDGCWITIGSCRIQDLGDELRIHGKCNDAAYRAVLQKAVDEWDSAVEIYGSTEFKDGIWLEAQRCGVKVYDEETGELYQPSPDVKQRFEVVRAKTAADVIDLEGVRQEKDIAELLRSACAIKKFGKASSEEMETLAELEQRDPALSDFVTLHLDQAGRARLVGKAEADIMAALPSFRHYGKTARDAQEKASITKNDAADPAGDGNEIDFATEAAKRAEKEAIEARREADCRRAQEPS